ncbi:unnamed protein product [Effrenium voratum]|nr:unnamed protein product [Effrenium voratum]
MAPQPPTRSSAGLGSQQLLKGRDASQVLKELAQARRGRAARQLLDLLREEGAEIPVQQWHSVIHACAKSREWQQGVHVLAQMSAQVTPEPWGYNTAIGACQRCNQWQAAVALLASMAEATVQQNVISYTWAVNGCLEANAFEVALRLVKSMQPAAVLPDAIGCSSAIKSCGTRGRWQEALVFLELMPEVHVAANLVAYNSAIFACVGRWEASVEILSSMPSAMLAPDVVSFSSAIKACSAAAEWRPALRLLADAAEVAALDSMAFSCAIDACGAVAWPWAMDLLRQMHDLQLAPDVYTFSAALSSLAAAGRWQPALQLLQAMREAKVWPNAVSYGAAMSACDKGGQWELVLQLLQEMPANKLAPDTICKSSAVSACASSLRWQRALALLPKQEDYYSYSSAINACARASSWPQALQLASRLQSQQLPPNGIMWGAILSVMPDAEAQLSRLRALWVGKEPPGPPLPLAGTDLAGVRCLRCEAGLLAVDKPAGLTSEQVISGISRWLADAGYQGIQRLSRLDAQTSGVMPVSLCPEGAGATSWFQLQFAARRVRKVYWALCSGAPLAENARGLIVSRLSSSASGQGSSVMQTQWSRTGKEARTEYTVLESFTLRGKSVMLLEAVPKTGRTHQIRSHLAGLLRPIVGDRNYQGWIAAWCPRLFLHCARISMQDAAGKPFEVEAPLPEDLRLALEHVRST